MKSVGMETNRSIITGCGIGDYFILITSVGISLAAGSSEDYNIFSLFQTPTIFCLLKTLFGRMREGCLMK